MNESVDGAHLSLPRRSYIVQDCVSDMLPGYLNSQGVHNHLTSATFGFLVRRSILLAFVGAPFRYYLCDKVRASHKRKKDYLQRMALF